MVFDIKESNGVTYHLIKFKMAAGGRTESIKMAMAFLITHAIDILSRGVMRAYIVCPSVRRNVDVRWSYKLGYTSKSQAER